MPNLCRCGAPTIDDPLNGITFDHYRFIPGLSIHFRFVALLQFLSFKIWPRFNVQWMESVWWGDDRLYVKNRSIAAVGHTSSVRPQTRLQCAVPDPFNYLHIYILPLFTYTSTTLRYVCQSFPIALLCCPTYAIGIQHTSFHNKFAYPQFRRCFRCCILH